MAYIVEYVDYNGKPHREKFSNREKHKAQKLLADVQSQGCIQASMYEE
jgi:hypothetical protein